MANTGPELAHRGMETDIRGSVSVMRERLVRLSRAKGESMLQDGKEMKEIFFDRPMNGSEFPYRTIWASDREWRAVLN